MLEAASWRRISWRPGTKGDLAAGLLPSGSGSQTGSTAHRHNGRAAADGLVGKRRSTGERKYYPSNLPADTALKDLALAIKARWVCEQAHQQSKEELAIDHFEGRSWIGLHPHALLATMAYSFL